MKREYNSQAFTPEEVKKGLVMSKYIRTPFAIFEVVEETDVVYRVRVKWMPSKIYSKSKCQIEVIKKADTIEELCDEFVHFINGMPFVIHKGEKHYVEKGIPVVIYGAIWTDKGLIYVAKMNNEGKLELL